MIKNQIFTLASVLFLSVPTFAQTSDGTAPADTGNASSPAEGTEKVRAKDETRALVAAEASKLGYDLSTSEGRKQFGDYLRAEREKIAAAAGIDMTVKDNKKQLREAIKSQVDAIAKEQGFDLSTKEGRDSLAKYLIANGKLALLPNDIGLAHSSRDRHNEGEHKKGDSQKSGDQASGDQVSSHDKSVGDHERRGGGQGHDQDRAQGAGQAGGANSGATQNQSPGQSRPERPPKEGREGHGRGH